MHPGVLRTAFFVVLIVLLAGLLAGCGGGDQAEGGSQGDGSEEAEQQNGGGGSAQGNQGKEKDKAAKEVKIALGTVASVAPEENEFSLQPSAEEQGEEPIPFKVGQNSTVTIAGEEAELVALQEGQQAQVRYVTVDGKNRARAVQVIGE
jgi:hypothetical protein